jgi:hypothetical protein
MPCIFKSKRAKNSYSKTLKTMVLLLLLFGGPSSTRKTRVYSYVWHGNRLALVEKDRDPEADEPKSGTEEVFLEFVERSPTG